MRINLSENSIKFPPQETAKKNPFQETASKIAALKKSWGTMDPEQLASKIIELEERVTKEPSMKAAVEHLHFDFVFPVKLDMADFVKEVGRIASDVLKTGSLSGIKDFSPTQMREIMRQARGE